MVQFHAPYEDLPLENNHFRDEVLCRRSRICRPALPSRWGPPCTPEGINFAIHSAGATRVELLLFDNIADRRPEPGHPALARDEPDRDVWHIFVEGLPNRTLYNYPRRRPVRPDRGRHAGSTPTKTLLDPYAPAITGDFYWQPGDRARATTTRDPDDPDRHLRPSTVDNVERRRPLRRLPERLRLGRRPPPRHPDRGVDHLRGERPRVHPPSLVRERLRRAPTAASSRRSRTSRSWGSPPSSCCRSWSSTSSTARSATRSPASGWPTPGATTRSPSSPPSRTTATTASSARRSTSSRCSSASCTRTASRSSSTSSSTTPARGTTSGRR